MLGGTSERADVMMSSSSCCADDVRARVKAGMNAVKLLTDHACLKGSTNGGNNAAAAAAHPLGCESREARRNITRIGYDSLKSCEYRITATGTEMRWNFTVEALLLLLLQRVTVFRMDGYSSSGSSLYPRKKLIRAPMERKKKGRKRERQKDANILRICCAMLPHMCQWTRQVGTPRELDRQPA